MTLNGHKIFVVQPSLCFIMTHENSQRLNFWLTMWCQEAGARSAGSQWKSHTTGQSASMEELGIILFKCLPHVSANKKMWHDIIKNLTSWQIPMLSGSWVKGLAITSTPRPPLNSNETKEKLKDWAESSTTVASYTPPCRGQQKISKKHETVNWISDISKMEKRQRSWEAKWIGAAMKG